jgi:hypothetical protein
MQERVCTSTLLGEREQVIGRSQELSPTHLSFSLPCFALLRLHSPLQSLHWSATCTLPASEGPSGSLAASPDGDLGHMRMETGDLSTDARGGGRGPLAFMHSFPPSNVKPRVWCSRPSFLLPSSTFEPSLWASASKVLRERDYSAPAQRPYNRRAGSCEWPL